MFISLLKLLLAVPFVLILPGFFLMLAIFGTKNSKISFFERAVLIVPTSLLAVDFLVLLMNRLMIPIRGPILISGILLLCFAGFAIFYFRFKKKPVTREVPDEKISRAFEFTTWQAVFILISLFLAFFFKVTYLSDSILPAATDLGHHMYWSQTIVNSGRLPVYGVPDFIIGEHIIFAVINLLSRVGLMTAMPSLVLLMINIVGIFTLAILAGRMFESRKITTLAIFSAGLLYTVSAPQARYVSGGVVGNVLGDALIPLCLYFFYRALAERASLWAGLFIFFFVGLLYTHHLSAFVLIFSLAAVALLYLVLNYDRLGKIIREWFKIFWQPFPVVMLIASLIFLVLVFTPSYFNGSAIGQATGEPSKITRAGLDLSQIENNTGSARLFWGALGFLLLLFEIRRRDYKYSFALAWAGILFVMSWKPGWLFVNIPSDRVGNYLFLPFSLLAAFGLAAFLAKFRKNSTKFLATVLLLILLFFVVTNGLSDSSDALKTKNQFQQIVETYHSAQYLAATVDTQKDILLKDHINIAADSWYKLFFMKDYKYPLSRGLLSRYVDTTKSRETCTRDMISSPDSDQARMCFSQTGVNYVIVNAQLEGTDFEKSPEFSKVYASNYLSIFKRN